MHLAATGFVSATDGSVAGANALLLQGLLDLGVRITFFSKPSFVDPRQAIPPHENFHFVDTTNTVADQTRVRLDPVPVANFLARRLDAATYNRNLVRSIRAHHTTTPFDAALWLGDFARGRAPDVPSISFVQGPPGTDARSIARHHAQIRRLCGLPRAVGYRAFAALRLARFGLPPMRASDHFIVGSHQSQRTFTELFGIASERISTLPYPIDLDTFRPAESPPATGPLRCLWLGRIVPRKRLDVFLDGAALAISRGLDLQLTLLGRATLIPELESLISAFPHPDRLHRIENVPRSEVPAILRAHDVLVQPSDEENFGSSVAEAQACGIPVIVGSTNGNADYLSEFDIHLPDDNPASLADALATIASRRSDPALAPTVRATAEQHFESKQIAKDLRDIIESTRDRFQLPCPA